MEKKNQKPREELIDEEDLLNFELDDLSLEDMEKKASEFEDDIIELVDLVEKGRGSEEGKTTQETVWPEEGQPDENEAEFGLATGELTSIGDMLDEEGLDHPESNLDLSGLSLSDLNQVSDPKPEEKNAEDEISEAELEEMLQGATTGMLDFELQDTEAPDEDVELNLEQQEAPEEELEAGYEVGQEIEDEQTPESDVKDAQQEADFEDITLDLEEVEEADEIEIPFEGDFEETMPAMDVDSVTLDLEEESAEALELDLDQEEAPIGILDVKRDTEIKEKTGDAHDGAAEEESLTSQREEPSHKEPVDLPAPEAAFQEPEALPVEPVPERTLGLSEEVIEDIVSRVVKDVVERVTRETMIEVAEKVINDAIDALKHSLESISD